VESVWNSNIGLMVDRWDRNPNCSGGSRLFSSSTCLRRLARIFSRIFPAMFRREIGRYDWVFSIDGGYGNVGGVYGCLKRFLEIIGQSSW
jgi:hypothetical protein